MGKAAVAALEERIYSPAEVTSRWVDAAYWSSDRVVCSLPSRSPGGSSTPLALVGDVAMGKPFFLGTTLNIHLAEVKAFSRIPAVRWGAGNIGLASGPDDASACASPEGKRGRSCYPAAGENSAVVPYLAHEQRYQQLLGRTPGFRR